MNYNNKYQLQEHEDYYYYIGCLRINNRDSQLPTYKQKLLSQFTQLSQRK